MVQVWNAETAEKIGELFSCTPPITVSFNSDGSRIAVMWDISEATEISRCQILDGMTARAVGGQTEHAGFLRTSAFSGDGKRLLLGYDLRGSGGEVCARDAIVGGPLQTLLTSKDAVPEAFDAAGVKVVTLGHESAESDPEKRRIARVWNLITGKPITNALKHDENLMGAIFSPDGHHIATHSIARAFLWDLATDSLIASTEPIPEDKTLSRIGYTPDAKLLLIVGVQHPAREMDWVAQLCDAKTGKLISGGEIRDHGLFESAAFSQDSKFLLLCSSGHRARVWRTRSGTEIQAEEATAPLEHADVVSAAKFSPDGKRILTASFDNTIRVWHATPGLGCALSEKIPTAQRAWFAEASPDLSRIVIGSQEPGGLQIFDGNTFQPRSQFIPHEKLVPFLCFSRDSRLLAAADEDGVATILDASDGRLVTQLKHPTGEAITSVKLDTTGAHAATATRSGAMLWDVASNSAIRLAPMSNEPTSGIEFSPDGARFLTIQDSELNMWDARSGARIWGPLTHAAGGGDASFSPDGTRFAVCGSQSVVDVRETMTGKRAYLLEHNGIAVDAKFSRDGKLIATCSYVMKTSGYAQVWDAATGAAITQPLTGSEEVHRVAFSPDGELLAATERGNGVRIWSIATGRECFDLLPQAVWHCIPSFTTDGKHLITVDDGVAYLHELWIPSEAAPAWLPDLAESVGGFSVNAHGVVGPIDDPVRKLNEVRATIAGAQKDDPLLHWARWFLADRRTRTISPFSQRTMNDEVAVNVETSTPVPITSTAVAPEVKPESSNNSGWLTSAEYQREFDARKSEFYPADIEGRCHDGREEFRAAWKRRPLQSAFESHHGITKQQFEDRGDTLGKQGYSLEFSAAFQDCNDVTRYQATWLKKT
jgi:WD40 repeat protein